MPKGIGYGKKEHKMPRKPKMKKMKKKAKKAMKGNGFMMAMGK